MSDFERDGFVGPFRVWTSGEMEMIRKHVVEEVLTTPGPANYNVQSRHLDSRVVWELCSHPAILDGMAELYGDDLFLWRSNFFVKPPDAKRIPWHQDHNYWPLDPLVNISAWIAITESTVANGAVQVIPGSHKLTLPHVDAGEEMAFNEMADPELVDMSQAITLEMEPGEVFLFNEHTLHHSDPNTTEETRIGLAVRVTVPGVRVDHDALFSGHEVLILRGSDTSGLNRIGQPPA